MAKHLFKDAEEAIEESVDDEYSEDFEEKMGGKRASNLVDDDIGEELPEEMEVKEERISEKSLDVPTVEKKQDPSPVVKKTKVDDSDDEVKAVMAALRKENEDRKKAR